MRSRRGRTVAGLASLCGLLVSCSSSTTSGTGSGSTPAPTVAPVSSQPGFPTSVGVATPAETTPIVSPSIPPESLQPTIIPAPAEPLRVAKVDSPDGAHYRVRIWADVKDETCFDHAYGDPIVTFLTKHPCAGLERYLATTTVNGRPVAFAESATGFPGTADDPYKYSSRFGKLEEQDGTGSLNDLLREGYRLPRGPTSVPAGEAFNVLGQDQGVTVWDVWYLDGPTPTNDPALIKMTQDLFLQF